jgi:GTP 3',8-cyclase
MTEKIQNISPLVDRFSRTISYLRLSLTDRCNLRCIYCMPGESEDKDTQVKAAKFLNHSDLLSYEELLRVVRLAVSMGMNKLRLTGGEPLVRKGVLDFIHQLSLIDGLDQLRLTTNGVLLEEYAETLFAEGVHQINVSLDTLQPKKFKYITGKDHFSKVWAGLQEAKRIGFKIKLNVVAMKGINDDEFQDFARLALEQPFQVRFIEFMPVGEKNTWKKDTFIRANEIMVLLAKVGTLTPFRKPHSKGPARMYEINSSDKKSGEVGFISPLSHHFCDECNRLRLTSEGKLRSCLLNDDETDLRSLIRKGSLDKELIQSIKMTVLKKPQGHTLQQDLTVEEKSSFCRGRMSRIGG